VKKTFFFIFTLSLLFIYPQSNTLDSLLRAIKNQYDVVGMSVILANRDTTLFIGSYGLRDIGRNLPVDANTRYRIASVAKMITAAVLMTLYDEGKFNLDADVSQYLGYSLRNPNFPNEPITIRKLLSHTSSLRDGSGYDNIINLTATLTTPPSLQSALLPGGANYYSDIWSSSRGPTSNYFTYSNCNYGLIGTIAERLSGMRFDSLARQRILLPLNISASFNIQDLPDINNLSVLYRKSGSAWIAQTDNYYGIMPAPRNLSGYVVGTNGLIFGPQGSLRITAVELARFLRMIMNGGVLYGKRILSQNAIDAMTLPSWTYNGNNGDTYYDLFLNYGFGCHRTSDLIPGLVMIGHPGEAYGLISDIYYDVNKNFCITFALNGGQYTSTFVGGYYKIETDIFRTVNSYRPTDIQWENQAYNGYSLENNFPNPFNSTTVITFEIPKTEFISLIVYDALGREVTKLLYKEMPAGHHSIEFDGADLFSGVYFYSLRAGDFIRMKKLILIK
jgi:CubicO group peptidase (beta-lactamase class C family)